MVLQCTAQNRSLALRRGHWTCLPSAPGPSGSLRPGKIFRLVGYELNDCHVTAPFLARPEVGVKPPQPPQGSAGGGNAGSDRGTPRHHGNASNGAGRPLVNSRQALYVHGMYEDRAQDVNAAGISQRRGLDCGHRSTIGEAVCTGWKNIAGMGWSPDMVERCRTVFPDIIDTSNHWPCWLPWCCSGVGCVRGR